MNIATVMEKPESQQMIQDLRNILNENPLDFLSIILKLGIKKVDFDKPVFAFLANMLSTLMPQFELPQI